MDLLGIALLVAILVIVFEQHCNIENLGRVNKVKVKRRITVESLQLEPLCNQSMEKFFKFSTMKLDRNMNHIMITSALTEDTKALNQLNTLIQDGK
ncbi:uncharacterized protein [Gossypium hirsutum]|uniref:Uncharacterized protein n=1 Tax=Gossypium hirsutum TaxID=3635 RepID=A0ABM2ZBD7_GOSHI|nr:uncharacterized protein LOC107938709 [Gossypium hirsutum]